MLLTPSRASRLVCSASGGGWLTTSSNLMMKRWLCCSWEHLLWDHNLTSVVSPLATLSSAAQPQHAILVLSSTSTLDGGPRQKFCSSAFYHLHHISRICDVLDIKTAATVVQALVISCLDYCNSLLYGLPSTLINRLQRVQNAAARVVARAGGWEHITPVLFRLHWLPVQYRITFKILLLTYCALHGLAPSYLTALLVPHWPSQALRSGQQHLLHVPQTRLLTFGDRSFAFAAPKLWNSLPCKIREAASLGAFKKALKTYLFGLAYSHLLGISEN